VGRTAVVACLEAFSLAHRLDQPATTRTIRLVFSSLRVPGADEKAGLLAFTRGNGGRTAAHLHVEQARGATL
jgi:hypothetical protein